MSDSRVVTSHVLTVRFDQLEDNSIQWYVEPDNQVHRTGNLSMLDLAECGAPLAAMGIRALWKMCIDGLVHNALEQANDVHAAAMRRLQADEDALVESSTERVTIN
jgi:hypothetical protein